MILEVTQHPGTVLKLRPNQDNPPENQMVEVEQGDRFDVERLAFVDADGSSAPFFASPSDKDKNFLKVVFSRPMKGKQTWFAFGDHVKTETDGSVTYLIMPNSSEGVFLKQSTRPAEVLEDDNKFHLKEGEGRYVAGMEMRNEDHIELTLAKPINSITTWLVRQDLVDIWVE